MQSPQPDNSPVMPAAGPPAKTWRQQLHGNAVAFISLFVALSSLGYNTWRNETTEHQRNVRHAAFVLVEQLGEFQSRANQVGYAENASDQVQIAAWSNVLTMRTLSRLLPDPVPAAAASLADAWAAELPGLRSGDQSRRDNSDRQLTDKVDSLRDALLKALAELE